ncbi:hypothetical protein AGLY_008369 [Aphis glycines]|uniref:Uncharacterized protein n=1 Tax=Aphis glycines TaxID=307491 RepID=A0A6G0TM74_APHGL|nr:hypothetical protein AGLY_008369 [Aphis glycines]
MRLSLILISPEHGHWSKTNSLRSSAGFRSGAALGSFKYVAPTPTKKKCIATCLNNKYTADIFSFVNLSFKFLNSFRLNFSQFSQRIPFIKFIIISSQNLKSNKTYLINCQAIIIRKNFIVSKSGWNTTNNIFTFLHHLHQPLISFFLYVLQPWFVFWLSYPCLDHSHSPSNIKQKYNCSMTNRNNYSIKKYSCILRSYSVGLKSSSNSLVLLAFSCVYLPYVLKNFPLFEDKINKMNQFQNYFEFTCSSLVLSRGFNISSSSELSLRAKQDNALKKLFSTSSVNS